MSLITGTLIFAALVDVVITISTYVFGLFPRSADAWNPTLQPSWTWPAHSEWLDTWIAAIF